MDHKWMSVPSFRPALASTLGLKGQDSNMPLCPLRSPCYAPDSHLALACSPLLLSLCSCSSNGLGVFCHSPCREGWRAAVGRSQLPVLVPSPILALQQQPDRPVSPEAEGLWGLLSSTLSKMKIIASRKMHPFSVTNPWCGNVLTFNEVHLCRSAGSEGETRHWRSLPLPPLVLSLILGSPEQRLDTPQHPVSSFVSMKNTIEMLMSLCFLTEHTHKGLPGRVGKGRTWSKT